MFDTLITNGTIIDGSNKKSYKGDIGIIGGKINTIGLLSNAESKETINAKDSIVCPGFIDVHSHDDFKILSERKITHNILQGITTMIVGNCGFGISPYEAAKEQMSALYQVDSLKNKWNNFADFFDLIEKNPPSINVGVLIGHHTIRRAILNEINKKIPNSDELNKMIYLVEEGMEAGCLGFSTGLVYEPGRYSNTEELINLTKPLRKYNGVYVSHMRNEAEKLFHSISETINIGTKAGTKIQISHLKSVGKENWGKVGKALEIIENHNLNGIDITADQYPYTARSTMLKALYINGTFDEPKVPEKVHLVSLCASIHHCWDKEIPTLFENIRNMLIPEEGLVLLSNEHYVTRLYILRRILSWAIHFPKKPFNWRTDPDPWSGEHVRFKYELDNIFKREGFDVEYFHLEENLCAREAKWRWIDWLTWTYYYAILRVKSN